MNIRIVPFSNKHQPLVDELLQKINVEFKESMFSSASVPMKNVAHIIGNQFWVAMDEDVLIGTIGVLRIKNKNAVIKSMFVANEYRGKQVAKALLDHAMAYCKKRSIETVYLGTMEQMKAAHRFYEKNGFVKINEEDCPTDFNKNPVDGVFYRMILIS